MVWMGEAEGSLERMESRETKLKVDDVTKEIRERDERFRGLLSRGREQLGYSGDSDIVLSSKVEELNRRWTGLQNSVLNLSGRVGRVDDQHGRELSDLRSWVRAKVLEVEALKVGKNFVEIHRQSEEHSSFRSVQ